MSQAYSSALVSKIETRGSFFRWESNTRLNNKCCRKELAFGEGRRRGRGGAQKCGSCQQVPHRTESNNSHTRRALILPLHSLLLLRY